MLSLGWAETSITNTEWSRKLVIRDPYRQLDLDRQKHTYIRTESLSRSIVPIEKQEPGMGTNLWGRAGVTLNSQDGGQPTHGLEAFWTSSFLIARHGEVGTEGYGWGEPRGSLQSSYPAPDLFKLDLNLAKCNLNKNMYILSLMRKPLKIL